jgi:hypothetical protein
MWQMPLARHRVVKPPINTVMVCGWRRCCRCWSGKAAQQWCDHPERILWLCVDAAGPPNARTARGRYRVAGRSIASASC